MHALCFHVLIYKNTCIIHEISPFSRTAKHGVVSEFLCQCQVLVPRQTCIRDSHHTIYYLMGQMYTQPNWQLGMSIQILQQPSSTTSHYQQTLDDQFPWPLFGCNDRQRESNLLDVDDGLVGLAGPWDSQLRVLEGQQLGRHILQLQSGQLHIARRIAHLIPCIP